MDNYCYIYYYKYLHSDIIKDGCHQSHISWLLIAEYLECDAGSYSVSGYEPSTLCPLGELNTETQQTSCTECEGSTTTLSLWHKRDQI